MEKRNFRSRRTRDIRSVLYSNCTDKKIGVHPGGRADRVSERRDPRCRGSADDEKRSRREPVDLAGRPCRELLRGSLTHHLPNDRSVDAMLDHPWIIRAGSAMKTVGGCCHERRSKAARALRLESRSDCARTRQRL